MITLGLFANTTQMIMAIVWLLIVVVAIILEEQTAELVSIWFAVGSIFGIVGALLNWPIYVQFIIFAVVTAVLVLVTRPLAKKLTKNSQIKTNADRLIGMKGKLTKAITEEEKGEIKIDFQYWSAVSVDNRPIPEGTEVVVKEIVGNRLVVDVIEEIELN